MVINGTSNCVQRALSSHWLHTNWIPSLALYEVSVGSSATVTAVNSEKYIDNFNFTLKLLLELC